MSTLRPRAASQNSRPSSRIPEQQAAAALRGGGQVSGVRQIPHIRGDRGGAVAGQRDVGRGAKRRAAPRHGGADLGEPQQLVIVLGVADRQRVAGGQAQRVERRVHARALADALRQRHHTALVEDQHQRQFERANHVENRRRIGRVGVDQRLPGTAGNAAARELVEKRLRHGRREQRGVAALGKVQHRAVLGDHAVNKVQLAGDAPEVVEDAPGREEDGDTARANQRDRITNRRIEPIIPWRWCRRNRVRARTASRPDPFHAAWRFARTLPYFRKAIAVPPGRR